MTAPVTAPVTVRRVGWTTPKPEHIPRPTAWPPALALGIMLSAWGLVTSLIVLGIGVTLFVIALAGWIGEIRHEHIGER